MEEILVYQIALVGVAGVGAQWLAWRLHLPGIVLLAIAGVLAGPVFHLIDPHRDLGVIFAPLVAVAVAVILFEGGLSLSLTELRGAGPAVRRLLAIGIPVTWLLSTLAGHYVAALSWPVATLFGAILVITGPTVVVPLIRQAKLTPRVSSVLKWEAIVNDPIGAVLAVLVFEIIAAGGSGTPTARSLVQFLIGAVGAVALGVAAGRLLARAFHAGHVPEFLKAPAILCAVLVCFAVPNGIQAESGLVAAAVFGAVLAHTGIASIAEMRRFKEYLTVLLVGGVFVLLTATLRPGDLLGLGWRTWAFVGAVLFLIRPLAALTALYGTPLSWQERAMVAWIAPRGVVAVAVTGFFGPILVELGYADAAVLVPLSFAVVFATVIAHGFSIGWLGRRLGLAAAARNGVLIVGANPWSTALAKALMSRKITVRIADTAWMHLGDARRAGIPVYYGEVLSEPTAQTLDLTGIGYLIAATDNDAYNA
ncbi:MAG: sodium:proton antiporter, partial [Alphaproteobacteria bacterium]